MSDSATSIGLRAIVDARVHLYEGAGHAYPHFKRPNPTLKTGLGDYSALPKMYVPEAYKDDTQGYKVDGIVWHGIVTDDTLEETRWAQRLADTSPIPQAIVARVDFLNPILESQLERFQDLRNLTALGTQVGSNITHPQRDLTGRSDLFIDPTWTRSIALLRKYNYKCVLEASSLQLKELLAVVSQHPNVGFTLAVMGWPQVLDTRGFAMWWKDIKALSFCENVVADISAIECIFGMDWTCTKIAPWVLSLIEIFGPSRCMFGSHLPAARLSHGFTRLYDVYEHLVSNFSATEQDQMFRRVALHWFGVR